METNFRFILDKSSRQFNCPNCGKRRFVRFIDKLTKEYLPEKYGKCNRRDHCRYFVTPYSDKFFKNQEELNESITQPSSQTRAVYYLPEAILSATLKDYNKNSFVINLLRLAPLAEIMKLIKFYNIGTVSKGLRAGAATFPFIDYNGNIRTIQVKQFDNTNHTVSTDFLHSILMRHYNKRQGIVPEWLKEYSKNEKFVTCLFGEHLLARFPDNPVALVEAPKTAVIGSLYYGLPIYDDDLLWLAVYNKSSLTLEKCEVLKGRKVVLFPDLNAYTDWGKRASELQAKLPGTRFVISDLLEKYANEYERTKSLDLADYLTKFKYNQFWAPISEAKVKPFFAPDSPKIITDEYKPIPNKNTGNEKSEIYENIQLSFFAQLNNSESSLFSADHETWLNEIQSIELFFNSVPSLEIPFRLNQCTIIHDLPKFISGHLAILRTYNGNKIFLPYLKRLQLLQQIIQS